ncbi:hypothetical protein BLOT_000493 [Blomia tropicalis]|nr:hypothetical protein BLOT_000493 [Blomia tropicalis]
MLENVMPSTIWLLSLPAIRHSHLPYRTSSNESSPDCGSMSGNGICARRDKNVLHASICIIVSIINGILDHASICANGGIERFHKYCNIKQESSSVNPFPPFVGRILLCITSFREHDANLPPPFPVNLQ